MKDLGLPRGRKVLVLFPVPVGPEMEPDMVSATISVPHLVGGLGELVLTAVGSDEGLATGENSTSGRAISGSGLGATPVFQGEFPRLQLPQNDRHAIAIAESYQWI